MQYTKWNDHEANCTRESEEKEGKSCTQIGEGKRLWLRKLNQLQFKCGATMKPATKTIKRMLNRKLSQKENARTNLHKPMTNGLHARRWLEGMKWNEHEK